MKTLLILAAVAGSLGAQVATTEISAPQITSLQMLRRAEMMGDLKTIETPLASDSIR